MHIHFERLAEGSKGKMAEPESAIGKDALRIVAGSGRGCVLYGQTAAVAILVPLKGRVQFFDRDTAQTLTRGQLVVFDAMQSVQITGRGPALWIMLMTSEQTWRALTGSDSASCMPGSVLLPAQHDVDKLVLRSVAALVRAGANPPGDGYAIDAALVSAATAIADLQAEYHDIIDRCPGRTYAQRRGVFLRLQRVRNLMTVGCHRTLDLAECARIASYSPCHFIRAFSAAFGETPHALLIEQRLRHAHRLLNTSVLAVAEVARISGYEDRSAFARSFKRRFGITATDVRGERYASLRAVA
ncbi:MAG: helix-turn-helix transcriptional regulator [Dokdonella sp.]